MPLGVADHLVWERPAAECGKKHRRKQRPISDKESRKWLHSLEKTAQLQAETPQVHLVNIADREGDIYDYFVTAQRLQIDVLVRAAWDRRLAGDVFDHASPGGSRPAQRRVVGTGGMAGPVLSSPSDQDPAAPAADV
ncbi:MAG TPA: hypothetical protein VJA64_09825, partial [Desulfobaccales bacterium]|nr:hypothetical protein [Desulfobaccales bacterium]